MTPDYFTTKDELSHQHLKEFSFNRNFYERSTLTQEIVSNKPDFFEKWSLPVFFLLIILLTGCAWLIRSPNVIQTKAILTSTNIPQAIVARQSGIVVLLPVNNNQAVKKNDVIGLFKSNADPVQIMDLHTRLDSSVKLLEKGKLASAAILFKNYYTTLGDLQDAYYSFITALQHQPSKQAFLELKETMASWIKKFTIQASADGTLTMVLPLLPGQYVQEGKLLGYVTPVVSDRYAKVLLEQRNLGKLDTGMTVQLRFDAYPYQENGTVMGTLSYISASSDSTFWGIVKLDNGLVTNQHKTIPYREGLTGQALMIPKNMRLAERFYHYIIR